MMNRGRDEINSQSNAVLSNFFKHTHFHRGGHKASCQGEENAFTELFGAKFEQLQHVPTHP